MTALDCGLAHPPFMDAECELAYFVILSSVIKATMLATRRHYAIFDNSLSDNNRSQRTLITSSTGRG